MTHESRCIQSFHYLRDAIFGSFAMSSSSPYETAGGGSLNAVARYALRNPVKFVALATLTVTGAVPLGVFLLYAGATVVCTVVAAIALDLALLTLGVFLLAVALCFALCISGGVAGLFSVVYFACRIAAGGVNQARRTRLVPSTVAPSSSEGDGETFDKHKHQSIQVVAQDLLTSLIVFLDFLTGGVTHSNTTTGNRETGQAMVTEGREGEGEEEGGQSDLCRTSLVVGGLAAATFSMSYAVLVAVYVVIHFT